MTTVVGWTYGEAVAWLEDHVNLEAVVSGPMVPTLDRVRAVMEMMGDPQRAAPVVHLTGTNGKGSTARMISALLSGQGLSVGTYTSPDLERVNERLAWGLEPISDDAFAEVLEAVSALEEASGRRLTRFEVLTAAAYRWFADVAVDAAVVEVGMGGRWDATNVADADVAVVTNVALDHVDVLGPTVLDIAGEKAGIVKPASTLVLGEVGEAADVFRQRPAAAVWERGRDFAVTSSAIAHGGRVVSLRTPGASYEDVYLPVHGAHQGENAALAVAAAEAFFDAPLADDVVAEAFAGLSLPGRMEVVARRPLVVLDGAHNVAGARAAAAALAEAFGTDRRLVLVAGMVRGREPGQLLAALGLERASLAVVCPAPSPRSLPPGDVAAAARAAGVEACQAASVPEAVAIALDRAGADDLVFVTGSLYVVGAARAELRRRGAGMDPAQNGR